MEIMLSENNEENSESRNTFEVFKQLFLMKGDLVSSEMSINEKKKKFKFKIRNFLMATVLLTVLVTYLLIDHILPLEWGIFVYIGEFLFLLIFVAYIPKLSNEERYRGYKVLQRDLAIIDLLQQISVQVELCIGSIIDTADTSRLRINYSKSRGRYVDLLRKIKAMKKFDRGEIQRCIDSYDLTFDISILLETEFDKHQLFTYLTDQLISELIEQFEQYEQNEQYSEQHIKNLLDLISSRSWVELQGKYIKTFPTWLAKNDLAIIILAGEESEELRTDIENNYAGLVDMILR